MLQRFCSFSGVSGQDGAHLLKGDSQLEQLQKSHWVIREPRGDTWQVQRGGTGLLNLIMLPQTQRGVDHPQMHLEIRLHGEMVSECQRHDAFPGEVVSRTSVGAETQKGASLSCGLE